VGTFLRHSIHSLKLLITGNGGMAEHTYLLTVTNSMNCTFYRPEINCVHLERVTYKLKVNILYH